MLHLLLKSISDGEDLLEGDDVWVALVLHSAKDCGRGTVVGQAPGPSCGPVIRVLCKGTRLVVCTDIVSES